MPGGHPEAARGSIGKEHFAGERCGGWTAAVREHEASQSFVEIPRNRDKEAPDVVKLAAIQTGEHMSPTNTGRENGCRATCNRDILAVDAAQAVTKHQWCDAR